MDASARGRTGPASAVPGYRTGPVGRAARVVLAGVAVLALASILDEDGVTGFRDPSVPTEPLIWVLSGLLLGAFVALVGALADALERPSESRRWQVLGLALLAIAVVAAAGAGLASSAQPWGFPLSDLVWWFDVLMLIETIVAVSIAIVLGAPGCEVGVWPALMARARGETSATVIGPTCVVGIHFIDEWEARRSTLGGGRE